MAGAEVPEMRVPPSGFRLWRQFWELCQFREERGRIRPRELMDYAAVKRLTWLGWEIDALMSMDAMWVKTTNEEFMNNQERMSASKALKSQTRGGRF